MTSIRTNAAEVALSLKDIPARQIPFALASTINIVVQDAQAAQVRAMHRAFQIRRADFLRRQVKIHQFASKRDLRAHLGFAGDRADVFAKFEAGGTKTPRGGRTIAVPVEARRNKRDLITAANRPKQLLATASKRAFLVRGADGDGVILQRVGRGRRTKTRVLYGLTPRVQLPASLGFVDRVTETVMLRVARAAEVGFSRALASAR